MKTLTWAIIVGAVLWLCPLPLVVILSSRLPDAVSPWWLLVGYLLSLAGMVLVMIGLRSVPDKADDAGVTHHRGPVLLIWFGAVIIVLAVVAFTLLVGLFAFAGLLAVLAPLGFVATPILAIGGFVASLILNLPPAIIGAVYLYQGISLLVTRRKAERTRV